MSLRRRASAVVCLFGGFAFVVGVVPAGAVERADGLQPGELSDVVESPAASVSERAAVAPVFGDDVPVEPALGAGELVSVGPRPLEDGVRSAPAQEGSGFVEGLSRELVEQRSDKRQRFENPNGTVTDVISVVPRFFDDGDSFEPISTDLVEDRSQDAKRTESGAVIRPGIRGCSSGWICQAALV